MLFVYMPESVSARVARVARTWLRGTTESRGENKLQYSCPAPNVLRISSADSSSTYRTSAAFNAFGKAPAAATSRRAAA